MNQSAIDRLMQLREESYRKIMLYLLLCGHDPIVITQGKIARATYMTRNQARHAIDYLESNGFISVSRGLNETSITIIGLKPCVEAHGDDDINRIIVDLCDMNEVAQKSEHKDEHNAEQMPEQISHIFENVDITEINGLATHESEHNHEHNSAHMPRHESEHNTAIIEAPIIEHKDEHNYWHESCNDNITSTNDISDIAPKSCEHIIEHNIELNLQEFIDNAVVTTSQRKEPKENEYIYINNSQSLESNPSGLDKEIELKKETSKERNPIFDAVKAEAIPKKQAAMLYEYYMEKLRGGTRAKAVDKIEDLLCGTHFIAKNKQHSPEDLISSIDSYAEDIKDMDKRIVYRPEYFFGRELIFTAYLPGTNLDKAFLENKEAALVQRNDAIEIHALYARHLRNDTRPHDAVRHIEHILSGSHEKCQGKPVPKDDIIEAVLAYSRNKRGTEKKYIHAPCNFFGTKGVVFDWLENKNGVHHEVAPYEEPDPMKNRIEIVL